MLAIEDYALLGDCEGAALVGRNFCRLALLPPIRFAGVLRGAARQVRERTLARRPGW